MAGDESGKVGDTNYAASRESEIQPCSAADRACAPGENDFGRSSEASFE